MVTEGDIMNLALSRLGQSMILDVDLSTQQNAKIVRSHYPVERDHCLRLGDWSFATKRVVLSPSPTAPAFGYDYQYDLPFDFIGEQFVCSIGGGDLTYEIEGRTLLCNENGVWLTYTFKNTQTDQYSPEFISLLKLALARVIAYPITLSEPISRSIYDEFEMAKVEYLSMDSKGDGYDNERSETNWGSENWA